MSDLNLERLRQDVRNEGSVVDAAIVFISGLVNRLRAASMAAEPADTQAQVNAIADELEQHQTKLASAIAANTDSEDDGTVAEPDHGPIDDSQTTPTDGSPTVDPTQQPAGGEPTTTSSTDSNDGAVSVADTTTDTNATSAVDSDQPAPGVVPADNTTLAEPPAAAEDSVVPTPADEPGVAPADTTQPTTESDPNQGQISSGE